MEIRENLVGTGEVYLIAGGGKTYVDKAAKFCRSTADVKDIIASDTVKSIIDTIIDSGHYAALEFDDFIFGIEGFARVTETQMVRKRIASYMISSGRVEHHGKRTLNVTIPASIKGIEFLHHIDVDNFVAISGNRILSISDIIAEARKKMGLAETDELEFALRCDYHDILNMIAEFYDAGLNNGVPEEELRYMTPQATSFKAVVKLNAHALRDWATIRMCNRAQYEIRCLVTKMVQLATEANPDAMRGVGRNCDVLGYCPEKEQCEELRGIVYTKAEALDILRRAREENRK